MNSQIDLLASVWPLDPGTRRSDSGTWTQRLRYTSARQNVFPLKVEKADFLWNGKLFLSYRHYLETISY